MDRPSFDVEAVVAMATRFGHNGLLGFTLVAHGVDWSEIRLPYHPRLAGDAATGVLASGPILSLMDMASACAVWIRRGRFTAQATLDLRIDHLRAAIPGRDVFGRSECYRLTRRVAFVRGQAHDGDPDDPIASVAATFMLLDEG